MKILWQWDSCTIGFFCPECGKELVGDSQDGEEECDCGLKYSLSSRLIVNGKENHEYEYYRGSKL